MTATSARGARVDTKKIALAIENATYDSPFGQQSMRKEDHQAVMPIFVAKATKSAPKKVDGTDIGFEVLATVPGPRAAPPVDPQCKMQRPS